MRRPATEATLTIAPPPRLFMCGITAWVPLNGPRRLTAMMRSQSATGIAAIVCRVIVPAELTSTSMPPSLTAISSARRAKASPSATSSACPAAPPPISAATRCAASPSRSITATRAPAAANTRALAAPMPLPPPVTRTVFPVKSSAIGRLLFRPDEPVDLAVAEQPESVLLDHLVGVAAARTDFRPFRAVLNDGPVRAYVGGVVIELDGDVGHEMDRARPGFSRPGSDVARQLRDGGAAGALAEGGVPGAVPREQRGHAVIVAAVEPEAIFGQQLADRALFLKRGGHGLLQMAWLRQCSLTPARLLRFARNDGKRGMSLRGAQRRSNLVQQAGGNLDGRICCEPGCALRQRRAGTDALRDRCRGRHIDPARH